jgi:PIN domain nuclease of toxin-antitoxin system
MRPLAADTHAVLWFLENDSRLSAAATDAMDAAHSILVPSVCLVEIIYLVEKRRLDAAVLPRLLSELSNPSTTCQTG